MESSFESVKRVNYLKYVQSYVQCQDLIRTLAYPYLLVG